MIKNIVEAYRAALSAVAANISQFTTKPGVDFTRNRKLGIETVLNYIVTNGDKSSKNELLDLCRDVEDKPSVQAMVRQRSKLLPDGVKQLLHEFNGRAEELLDRENAGSTYDSLNCTAAEAGILSRMRWEAVDGSTFVFSSDHRYAGEEYYTQSGPDQRGTYSMFLTAMYDLSSRTYTDGIIQPVHQMDERRALCDFVDARALPCGAKRTVIIADRGYASYNVLAHMIENQQYFVIRFPDVTSAGGMLHHMGLPMNGTWDKVIDIELTRSKSKKIVPKAPIFRVLENGATFDYLPMRSQDTYRMKLRVIRLDIDGNGTYECLVTNLPANEFPMGIMRLIYEMRWGIETSFRELKYTIGAIHFHAARPQLVQQEIWGAMLCYNIAELIAQDAASQRPRKNDEHFLYRVNFSQCAYIVKNLLRERGIPNYASVLHSIQRELVAVRPNRHFVRAMSKRARRRSYFTYRSA